MWDAIIVSAIVLAAATYAVRRLFVRPSCGCCGECGRGPAKRPDHGHACCCSGGSGCSRGR